ncbi:MAG: hypothetical protein AAGF11_37195 [Myxococcota bacterium]
MLQQSKLRVSDEMGWVHVDHQGWLRPEASEHDAVLFELEPAGARYRIRAPDGRYLDIGDGGRVGLCVGHHAECTLGPRREGVGRALRIDGAPLEAGARGSRVYVRLRDGSGSGPDRGGCVTVVEPEPSPEPSPGFLLVTESAFVQVLMQEIDLKGEFEYEQFDRLGELATELVEHIYRQARRHGLGSPVVRRNVWSWLVETIRKADVVLPTRLELVSSQLMAEAQSRLRLSR